MRTELGRFRSYGNTQHEVAHCSVERQSIGRSMHALPTQHIDQNTKIAVPSRIRALGGADLCLYIHHQILPRMALANCKSCTLSSGREVWDGLHKNVYINSSSTQTEAKETAGNK